MDEEEITKLARTIFEAARQVEIEARLESMASAPQPMELPQPPRGLRGFLYRYGYETVHVVNLLMLVVMALILWRVW